MKRNGFIATALGIVLLAGTVEVQAASWVKNETDIPNKNLAANYYDGSSVKVRNKTLQWTEKNVLTAFGSQYYSKYLKRFPACEKGMAASGEVTYHQIDFEIKNGNFRTVAKRNYNKDDKLICTDKDMGKDLDKSWQDIKYQSPMYFREYELVTKYNLGNI